jgi:branched-chain amino acid transport system substrate-binding protein
MGQQRRLISGNSGVGWIAGMIVEAALKGAGADATPAKVRAALQNLKVDMQGLRGGPIEWTSENHFRLKQYYRVSLRSRIGSPTR